MHWLLPEHVADALPAETARIEHLRGLILQRLQRCGYEQVIPPLIEYVESLFTGAGKDLDLRTFKLVDQLSGRTLGLRADMTPQTARIDAHLLNREGVTRLSYCGNVLHTLPASSNATRDPLQIGAELYGYSGLSADLEILRLLKSVLQIAELAHYRIDVGHAGVFRALVRTAGLDTSAEAELLQYLQAKDAPALLSATAALPKDHREAIAALSELYGDPKTVLAEARTRLPAGAELDAALQVLDCLLSQTGDLPISLDLADLRGYHYHNGIVFAVYLPGYPSAIAQGGRYDNVGYEFGRARPATGFSLDLKELARLSPARPQSTHVILSPGSQNNPELATLIEHLRSQGEVVIERLPDEQGPMPDICSRGIIQRHGQWVVESTEYESTNSYESR